TVGARDEGPPAIDAHEIGALLVQRVATSELDAIEPLAAASAAAGAARLVERRLPAFTSDESVVELRRVHDPGARSLPTRQPVRRPLRPRAVTAPQGLVLVTQEAARVAGAREVPQGRRRGERAHDLGDARGGFERLAEHVGERRFFRGA